MFYFYMGGFDEYYNIKELPNDLVKAIDKLNVKFKGKYPNWSHSIEVEKDSWPEGNTIRLNYGQLTLSQVSEIDHELHKLFQKHNIQFEVTSGGFSAEEN